MMTTESKHTPGIDRLRELNERLRMLLLSPHPGLTTWRKALSETLMEMADFAGYGQVSHLPASHDRLLKACKEFCHSMSQPCPDYYAMSKTTVKAHAAIAQAKEATR